MSITTSTSAPTTTGPEGREGTPDAYSRVLGARLREIRVQKGFSLTAVEHRSSDEFKASVLGAYERGERTIAVSRLMRLAAHYQVPVEQLLPDARATAEAAGNARRTHLRLDLNKVARHPGPEGEMLRRNLGLLQVSRQDFNGQVMTVRHDDARPLAAIFGVREDKVRSHLADLGLLVDP
jgi:transcriptional regulator with XRE-family HTH domain